MTQYIAYLNPRHLVTPLPTLEALKGGRICCEFRNAPDDCDNLAVVMYDINGNRYAALPCDTTTNGDWQVKIGGSFFATAGKTRFEVIATDEDGTTIPMGWGNVLIGDFGSGDAASAHNNVIMELPDADGNLHKVIAVQDDETGEWTWQISA